MLPMFPTDALLDNLRMPIIEITNNGLRVMVRKCIEGSGSGGCGCGKCLCEFLIIAMLSNLIGFVSWHLKVVVKTEKLRHLHTACKFPTTLRISKDLRKQKSNLKLR